MPVTADAIPRRTRIPPARARGNGLGVCAASFGGLRVAHTGHLGEGDDPNVGAPPELDRAESGRQRGRSREDSSRGQGPSDESGNLPVLGAAESG